MADIRATMQPVAFAGSGELVINDSTATADHLVVLDVESGEIVDRVDTGSALANGMFLSPGDDHDVWYCSTLTVSRVRWN